MFMRDKKGGEDYVLYKTSFHFSGRSNDWKNKRVDDKNFTPEGYCQNGNNLT